MDSGDLTGGQAMNAGLTGSAGIFRDAAVGYLCTDAALQLTEANSAFADLAGIQAGGVAGLGLLDLFIVPGDVGALLGSLRPGGPGRVEEWRLRRPERSNPLTRLSLSRLRGGYAAIVEDLSHRDDERTRLSDALRLTEVTERAARLGGWEMDVARRRLTWTEGMRRIHEVPEGFAPTPLEALGFVVPESRDAVNGAFLACARGGPVLDTEAEIVTGTGARRWVRITGEAQRGLNGEIVTIAGAFQDVSEQKAVEAANRHLAERLAATIESITDACFTLDGEGRFTYANARAGAVLGAPAEGLVGRRASDFPLLAHDGPIGPHLNAAAKRREMANVELRIAETDTWLELRAYPAADGLTVVLHDITLRRREAERLRLLEACVARLNDVLLITEAEPVEEPGPRIVFVNDAFQRITGYRPEEVTGRTPRILQGPGTPRAELDRIGAALRECQPVRAELLNYTKAGEEIWLELNIVPVADTGGRITHFVAVERDVTERKRAQLELEQQAALLDQVGDAIVVRDMSERIVYWNRAAERLYGWTAAEVTGRGVRDLVYQDPGAIDGPMATLLAEGEWSGRFAQRRRDGLPLVVDARWKLMRHPDGRPRAVLAVSTDITERLQLEERLRRSQRLEAVGQLTGGIAHDFNNLLTVILGNAEMLADSLHGDEELRGLAEMTVGAAERGAALTARLLAFSRRQALDPKVIRVEGLLLGLAPLLRRAVGERAVLRVAPAADLWPALIDPVQLETAVLNLCINARDAMPGGGELTVSAANIKLDAEATGAEGEVAPGEYVAITVTDTGCGMTPQVAARVFEPFFTTKEVGQGSGLGLSMVYGFMKQSGGHVRIQTAPGRGTSVRLYLPRGSGEGILSGTGEERSPMPGGSERILLVEDQALLRGHAESLLQDLGYSVLTAGGAAQALALLAAGEDVALLFTDVVLPGGMNGPELAEAARRLRPGLRVLLACGSAPPDEGSVAGIPVLGKPYRRRDLAEQVRRVLDRSR